MADFVKLSSLVGQDILIESVLGFQFKMWDNENKKMLISDNWQQGYRKLWQVVTDKGQLDMSQSQMANMLEGVCHAGRSDIIGATFNVKSNGKTGMEIRYYLNPVRVASIEQELDAQTLEEIGF